MTVLTMEPEVIAETKTNSRNTKEYNITDINRRYIEQFQLSRYLNIETDPKQKSSWNQYRCTLNNFLESLTKDAAMTKREDIDAFLNNSKNAKNKQAHIKAFYTFLITVNVNNCTSKMGRDLLIKIIEM